MADEKVALCIVIVNECCLQSGFKQETPAHNVKDHPLSFCLTELSPECTYLLNGQEKEKYLKGG